MICSIFRTSLIYITPISQLIFKYLPNRTVLFLQITFNALPTHHFCPHHSLYSSFLRFVASGLKHRSPFLPFLRAKAAMLSARLSHRNSVCPSVTRVDQSKAVEARITKS